MNILTSSKKGGRMPTPLLCNWIVKNGPNNDIGYQICEFYISNSNVKINAQRKISPKGTSESY